MKGMRNIAPFGLRMPEELKKRLSDMAEANGRSLNSQIVLLLEEYLDVCEAHKDASSFTFSNDLINTDPVQKALSDLYKAVRDLEQKDLKDDKHP